MHENPDDFWTEKLTDQDMGAMYIIFDEALVTRSSGSILFFKLQKEDRFDERQKWTLYQTIDDMRGNIYYIRGNQRIQVVTDEKIYFYLFNKKTLQPTLENVMYNYMNCSQMMFGAKVRYGITFKTGQ